MIVVGDNEGGSESSMRISSLSYPKKGLLSVRNDLSDVLSVERGPSWR